MWKEDNTSLSNTAVREKCCVCWVTTGNRSLLKPLGKEKPWLSHWIMVWSKQIDRKKSLNTHTSSHACAPKMAGASANAVRTRVLVLESMSNLQCFHHWKVRKLARERENVQTRKSENNNNSVWHDWCKTKLKSTQNYIAPPMINKTILSCV